MIDTITFTRFLPREAKGVRDVRAPNAVMTCMT